MGFTAYFLVVWDLIRHARQQGIRVGPGPRLGRRLCVAYCLRIVDLDPIRYDLLFERFLNPGRKPMPDIDMDFDARYRDEMIRYAAENYGRDHVAQIITFSTIKARAAVRDAARVLGYPYIVGDRIAKAMPPLVMGRDTPLRACFEHEPEVRGRLQGGRRAAGDVRHRPRRAPKVIDVAKGLEGLRRQDGIHAAAVVITRGPAHRVPADPAQAREPGRTPRDAPIVTQYEMHGVEELGLLKMDFLGCATSTSSTDTVDLIAGAGDPDSTSTPSRSTTPATLELLQRGDRHRRVPAGGRPDAGPDAVAGARPPSTTWPPWCALYRPGPMAANMHNDYADRKNGRKPIEYLHPDLEEVLGDTYGLMIYQESMMRVAQKFAGYSLAEADNLRKACGKKIRELIATEREKFVAGCERTGYGARLGTPLFDIIEPFADYAFNKSHAYGYGLVAYQTACLKAHYPVEYLACLLTSVKGTQEKTAVYLAECRAMGIEVLIPDINRSVTDFAALSPAEVPEAVVLPAASPGAILFGLSAVRNVGEGLVERC